MNVADRFFAKVAPDPSGSGCLVWMGALDSNGYGRFQDIGGRNMPAHRWLLERVYGRNEQRVADHLCRNTRCVRPSHLEFVTYSENVLRGVGPARTRAKAAARTHCIHGHELAGDNLYDYTSEAGKRSRICKACQRRNARSGRYHSRFALNQRRHRYNVAAKAASSRVLVLHGHGARALPSITVFAGDTEEMLVSEQARAVTLFREQLPRVQTGGKS